MDQEEKPEAEWGLAVPTNLGCVAPSNILLWGPKPPCPLGVDSYAEGSQGQTTSLNMVIQTGLEPLPSGAAHQLGQPFQQDTKVNGIETCCQIKED